MAWCQMINGINSIDDNTMGIISSLNDLLKPLLGIFQSQQNVLQVTIIPLLSSWHTVSIIWQTSKIIKIACNELSKKCWWTDRRMERRRMSWHWISSDMSAVELKIPHSPYTWNWLLYFFLSRHPEYHKYCIVNWSNFPKIFHLQKY